MQTWKDIKEQYPNEHVAIANPEYQPNSPTQLESGEVIDHDPELDSLLDRCNLSSYDSSALQYTGDLGAAIGQRGMHSPRRNTITSL